MTRVSYDVVVIGGGYAGATAANRLPRGIRTALVDPKADFVHRIRLHEFAAGGNPRVRVPFRRMLRNDTAHQRSRAVHVEPGLVRLSDGSELRTGHVLVTTGSDQATSDGIASHRAACAMRARLAQAKPGSHITVRGAGLTGIELAAELAYRRADLTIHLHGHSPVGADLPARAGDYLRYALRRLGVLLDSEGPYNAQSIDATGLHVSSLAHDSSLDTTADGQVRVTPTLESAPGIWGAGDAVHVDDQPQLRASCATAIPMGAHAADNIARALRNEPPAPFDFGYSFRCISLGRRSGLILDVDPLDTPTGRFMTGMRAAAFKWMVCAAALHVTSSARIYRWAAATPRAR